jgi:uncharacterized repeat protein (TIGR03803 family)
MKRFLRALGNLKCGEKALGISLLCAATTILLPAQTFTTLHSFDNTDGTAVGAGLLEALDGNLYGTTGAGGTNKQGTVYKLTPTGSLTTEYNFCAPLACSDGAYPQGALTQGSDGTLCGTTSEGGTGSGGTFFKITLGGTLTTLYSFCSQSGCADGFSPEAALLQAPNGNFYGTTYGGGSNGNYGTVFQITPSGSLTTLHSFCSEAACADGYGPIAPLVQSPDGNIYGTTLLGGTCAVAAGCGTLFKITPEGALITLHTFCVQGYPRCPDGSDPTALVQAAGGDLYGTTEEGGAYGGPYGAGTVYKITPSGTLTTLHSFDGTDGDVPDGLVQANDGNFYGTTNIGGLGGSKSQGIGTIFEMTPSGALTSLYSFCLEHGCPDGNNANGIIQSTNGDFYGTAYLGGSSGNGTAFSLSVGLPAFVRAQPSYGSVGQVVKLWGHVAGATRVTFDGTPTTFAVVSSSEITTTVPAGARSGAVQVVTPSGTLSGNVSFTVLP